MNFEQFVNNLKTWASENEVNLDDIHVSHGGSCMMLGIKLNSNDIDLTVTEKIFNRLPDAHREVLFVKTLTPMRRLMHDLGLLN